MNSKAKNPRIGGTDVGYEERTMTQLARKYVKYVWPCLLTGRDTGPNGKPIRIQAIIDGAGDLRDAVYNYMKNRKNAYQWLGCELTAITPLGQTSKFIYEPSPI